MMFALSRRMSEMALMLQAVCVLMLCLACTADAAELKQKTAEAFEHYIEATEARMSQESSPWQPFLWIDRMSEQRREVFYTKLREGQVFVEHLETDQNGEPIEIPDGLVHHWVGIVYIPGATIQRTVAVLQDYDNHQIT